MTGLSDREGAWKICVESNKPASSSYQYCENLMPIKKNRDRCKYDFCRMCCVSSGEMAHIKQPYETTTKCYKYCEETYINTIDSIIN